MTPTCLFHLCAKQNNKQQQHLADTDLSFSLRPGIQLYLALRELVLVCTNHQGLSYTLRARRGASSAVPLCSCAMGTLGGLALFILPSSTELWQDNVSPHGCCAARPENLREKSPLCSSPNLISSSQKYLSRVSLWGEGAFAGNGKPGHMWVCCGIPTSCAPWTTSLTNCQSFSQTSTEHKIAIKRPSTLATQTGINSGSIPEPNNTGKVFQSWNQCLISGERTEDTE